LLQGWDGLPASGIFFEAQRSFVDYDVPLRGPVFDVYDGVSLSFRGTRNVACTFGIIEDQFYLRSRWELLDVQFGLRPTQWASDAPEVKRHGRSWFPACETVLPCDWTALCAAASLL
jgi:hypothetical protein